MAREKFMLINTETGDGLDGPREFDLPDDSGIMGNVESGTAWAPYRKPAKVAPRRGETVVPAQWSDPLPYQDLTTQNPTVFYDGWVIEGDYIPPTLEEERAAACAKVNSWKEVWQDYNFTFVSPTEPADPPTDPQTEVPIYPAIDGVVFENDPRSRVNIGGGSQAASLAKLEGLPFSINWTAADNVTYTMNADEMISVGLAAVSYMDSYHNQAIEYKRRINEDAQTAEEINNILKELTYPPT